MHKIEQLRHQIEELDALLIEILAKRQDLSKQIGQLKSHHGKEIVDPLREEKLFAYYQHLSKEFQIEANYIQDIFKLILSHSKQVQKP